MNRAERLLHICDASSSEQETCYAQAAGFYTVDIEKHSMGVGLRCWPTNQDYNNGKDCSASIATYAHEAAGALDGEVHCSADSLHKGGAAAVTAADSESPLEEPEPRHASVPQV